VTRPAAAAQPRPLRQRRRPDPPLPQLGKRYAAEDLGLELLSVRGGEHALAVDGIPLALKVAKPLPASD
jgi:hypothetical protein